MLLIAIYDNIYDVSKYISKHPGEGIKDTYLRHYKNKNVTEEFERYHFTDESDEMLIKAKKESFDPETEIYYVCPFFFKKKIPKYFHFLPDDKYGIEYMKDKDINTFILRPSNSNITNSLCITYKNSENEINQLKIRKIESNKWYTLWENEEGEPKDIYCKTIEEIIQKIMISNNFISINQ